MLKKIIKKIGKLFRKKGNRTPEDYAFCRRFRNKEFMFHNLRIKEEIKDLLFQLKYVNLKAGRPSLINTLMGATQNMEMIV